MYDYLHIVLAVIFVTLAYIKSPSTRLQLPLRISAWILAALLLVTVFPQARDSDGWMFLYGATALALLVFLTCTVISRLSPRGVTPNARR